MATTEFKLNLLRPVSSGVCVAVADIVSLGKRSGVARIDITNGDKGRLRRPRHRDDRQQAVIVSAADYMLQLNSGFAVTVS